MRYIINDFFGLIYRKLFEINDTPQKISLGLGLGVFSGIFPGTGPLAAVFLALILRANRASSLIGSPLTNTWLSWVTFILAVKIGAVIIGLNWQIVRHDWVAFFVGFHWLRLLKLSTLKLILPALLGYIIVAFCAGLAAYLACLILLTSLKKHLLKP